MRADVDESITGINVTPLVDVTLVLLIIFMVTAKTVVAQTLPFDLLKEKHSVEQVVVFVVTIDRDGHVHANGQPMSDDESLRAAATSALSADAGTRAVIQASPHVSHGVVIHVLDQLRRSGMERVGFALQQPLATKPPRP
jgi:biopolymer transport protein ExbD